MLETVWLVCCKSVLAVWKYTTAFLHKKYVYHAVCVSVTHILTPGFGKPTSEVLLPFAHSGRFCGKADLDAGDTSMIEGLAW